MALEELKMCIRDRVKAVTRLHEVGISVGLRIIGATKIEDGGSGEDYVCLLYTSNG